MKYVYLAIGNEGEEEGRSSRKRDWWKGEGVSTKEGKIGLSGMGEMRYDEAVDGF